MIDRMAHPDADDHTATPLDAEAREPSRPPVPIRPDDPVANRRNPDMDRAMVANLCADRRGRPVAKIAAVWGADVPIDGPVLLVPGGNGGAPRPSVTRAQLDDAGRRGRAAVLSAMMRDLRVTRLREWLFEHAASAAVATIHAALVAIEHGEEPDLP